MSGAKGLPTSSPTICPDTKNIVAATAAGRRRRSMLVSNMVRAALAALYLALGCTVPAAAQERITGFASDISIAAGGTLTVRESISVQAENRRIEHGIFRDIPTIYTDR